MFSVQSSTILTLFKVLPWQTLLKICGLVVAEVFAFLMVLGVLGGDAYLVDVGIIVTHLVVEHHQECPHLLIAVLLGHILAYPPPPSCHLD